VLWTDIAPYRTEEELAELPQLYQRTEVLISPMNTPLSNLLYMYWSPSIDLNPEYQRGNVWTQSQKVALIHSIMREISIGTFVAIKRPYEEGEKCYEMLDGKQRLLAILDFRENRLSYLGKRWMDLHPSDQLSFDNRTISYAEITNIDRIKKLDTFLKLNTYGKPQSEEHLKNVKDLLTSLTQGVNSQGE